LGKGRVIGYTIDMYDIEALSKLLDQIIAQEKQIDILVNNAHELNQNTGFNTPTGSFENATMDQWMRNLTGGIYWAALCSQKVGEGMKKNKKGSIINISSMYGKVAPSPLLYEGTDKVNPPAYSAAKSGLIGLTRYIASFWGPYGIRANAILPGPFSNTEDSGPNSVKKDDPFLDKLKQRTCLRRVGSPNELIGPLLFLASDASSYVTGHELTVDGGWTVI
jgi:gluconate 5-dehydrogenase